MPGDADSAAIGALLSDPGRCRVLLALDDGRALPASRLASEAGVAPSTASEHLSKLVNAGLLSVERSGRHRYFRLAGPQVGGLLETMAQLAPAKPSRSLREGTRARQLRDARTCYDHLAGRLGVSVMAAMLQAGHLTGGDGAFDPEQVTRDRLSAPGWDADYQLTDSGRAFLVDIGVRVPAARPVRYCVDWTEQRHHLAGGAGRGLLNCLVDLGWIRRLPASRAVTVTQAGRVALAEHFNVDWPANA